MKKINNILKTNLALLFLLIIGTSSYANQTINNVCSEINEFENLNFQSDNLMIQSSSTTICSGENVLLEVLNMAKGSTCTWSSATSSYTHLNISNGKSVYFSPAVTTTYTVTVTNPDGTVTSLSETITVATPIIEVNSSSEMVCLGNTITLTASSVNVIPDENFEWSTSTATNPVLGKTLTITPTSVEDCYYSVTVTSSEGCSKTFGVKFIVRESPTILTTNTQICLGNTVTLSSNSTSSQNSWKDNNGVVIGSGASLSFSPTANYSYTVTNEYGCTSPSQSIIVSPNPIVAFTSNTSSICLGETITLTTTSTISNTDFSWSNSSNANAITSVYYEFTPTATGIYNYSVDGITGEYCADSDEITIIVNSVPTLSSSSSQICLGNSVILTATGSISYYWSATAGVNHGYDGSSINVSPTGNISYYATGENGCRSLPQSIIVSPNPIVTFTSNASSICLGETIALTTTSTILNTDFSWSNSSNANAITSVYYEFTPTATGIYNYSVSGLTGELCTDSDEITIIVNSVPTLSSSSNQICLGNSATLTATGSTSYYWSATAGVNHGYDGSSINVSPTGNTSYYATGENGCRSLPQSIIVSPNPIVTSSSTSSSICLGETVTLTANSSITNTNYTWTNSSNEIVSTEASFTITPTDEGTYTYTATGTTLEGCTNSSSQAIVISPNPVITVSIWGTCTEEGANSLPVSNIANTQFSNISGTSYMSGNATTFTITTTGTTPQGCSSTGSNSITLYPCQKSLDIVNEEIGYSELLVNEIEINNEVIYEFNRINRSAFQKEKPMEESTILVYPNPIENTSRIQITSDNPENSSIIINDISGRTIFNKEIDANFVELEVDFSAYNSGVYFVNLMNGESVLKSTKLIKK